MTAKVLPGPWTRRELIRKRGSDRWLREFRRQNGIPNPPEPERAPVVWLPCR